MFEIKIYGEIISTYAKQNGEKGVSLADVQAQLDKAEGKPVKVRINSVGGDVGEGFAIYDELRRYARQNDVKIHTFGEGMCASVATVILLAGEVREISRTMEPFVHNAQWGVQGDSRDFEEGLKVLDRWNDRIAKHYAEHTNLSYAEARKLMNQDTYITPDEAVRMRFATVVERVQRPTILAKFTNKNNLKMSKNKSLWGAITAALKTAGITNKILLDAEQREVDFFGLGEDENVAVGDKATIDGNPAEGEVIMSDGETYVFEGGELIEIREAGEDNNDVREDVDALKEEYEIKIEALEAEKVALTAKVAELQGNVKALRSTINTIKNLQSEEPVNTPRTAAQPKAKQPVSKGSRSSEAVAALLTNVKK